MTIGHSKLSRLYLNAEHISFALSNISCQGERSLGTTTSVLDLGYRGIPGLMEGALNLQGSFDDVPGVGVGAHDVIQSTIGVDNGALATGCPSGFAIGNPAFICNGDPSSYSVESAISDAVKFRFEATGNDGIDWGVVLHANDAVGLGTVNDTSVDNTAALSPTLNGGVAALHVSAVSGTGSPTATVKIQHSTDNITFPDLITFTAATAKTFEYKTVTGTVNRYIRASVTVTGTTPSFTFLVSFARR